MAGMKSINYSDVESHPGQYVIYRSEPGYIEIVDSQNLRLRVHVISEHILRFRYAIEGRFDRDFSYGLDPDFIPSTEKVQVAESDTSLKISTLHLDCHISKQNLMISIYDKQGRILSDDEKGFHWEKNLKYGGYIVQNSKMQQYGENYFGLGDKATELNLKGKRFVNWGTDEYGYHKNTDPLYKSIPLFYGLHDHGAYGIFFDNSFKSFFDFGKERSNVMSFWSQGGEMNYYFIAGPQLIDVAQRYTQLTGTAEMPPLWALGYQQCKWSYYPESKVMDIAQKMREYRIPCDALYLDIDYMDGFRCFTWDEEKFPNPKNMVDNLKAMGYQTMVIIDPGIKKDPEYHVFKEGLENDYFCKRIDGPYVEGKVWPGECYFPDFTKAEVRSWWSGLYKELIEDIGIAGVWNDMNEPALFEVESKTFPMDVLHDHDGDLTSHRKAHNIYGMQMARATADGVKKYRGDKRTLIITRSGYAGMQRYSSVWTGDNIADWSHIYLASVQAQRLAISGVSFCGSDIGGFIGQPTPEMMIRWIQLGIFHPFCRVHSSGDHGDQEPWVFGDECTNIFRQYVELRYQLLPYLYTCFYQYYKYGTPMMRPLVFVDQGDQKLIDYDHGFMCGDHILMFPSTREHELSQRIYLPRGRWYNFWTKESYEGQNEYDIDTPIDKAAIFIQAGSIIPYFPVQQYVGEKSIETIDLHIYKSLRNSESHLYLDDFDGYDYEKEELCTFTTFRTTTDSDKYSIQQIKSDLNSYSGSVKSYKSVLHGFDSHVSLSVDGKELSRNDLIPFDFETIEIK